MGSTGAGTRRLCENGLILLTDRGGFLVMISSDEIAEKLGVTRQTINYWAKKNRIPGFKVGRHWKFDEGEVLMALKLSGNKLSQAMRRIGPLRGEPR